MVSAVLQGFWGGARAPTWLRGWFTLEGEAAVCRVTRYLSSPLTLPHAWLAQLLRWVLAWAPHTFH